MNYWIEKIEISVTATPWYICVPKTKDGIEVARLFLELMKKELTEKGKEKPK